MQTKCFKAGIQQRVKRGLPTFFQTFPQERMFGQRGYLLNLILSSSDVVRNPVIFYIIVSRVFIILDDYVSRIGDLVSGLTDRSNIYHKLSVAQGEPSAIVALYIRVGKVFIVLAFALI